MSFLRTKKLTTVTQTGPFRNCQVLIGIQRLNHCALAVRLFQYVQYFCCNKMVEIKVSSFEKRFNCFFLQPLSLISPYIEFLARLSNMAAITHVRFHCQQADLATERERHLTTGNRAERTKLDFRSPICRSAIGQVSCFICARRLQLTFPFCC